MVGELRYKGIIFGDDKWGTIIDEKMPYKNDVGVEMKQYLIIPSLDLIESYPEILKKPNAINVRTPIGMAIWREYPTYFVTDLNPSRKDAIARVDCGFDGRPTPLTRRFGRLQEELKTLQEENETFRLSTISLEEEYKEILRDKLQIAQKLAELTEIMKGERVVTTQDEADSEH